MRKLHRLRLLVLLHLRRSPDVSPSLLSTPVETRSPPSEAHPITALRGVFCKTCAFGGGGRNRTAVQKSFALKGLRQFFILKPQL